MRGISIPPVSCTYCYFLMRRCSGKGCVWDKIPRRICNYCETAG